MAGEIEFLPEEPEAGHDGQPLLQPPVGPRAPRPARVVWAVRAAVIVALAAAGIAWAATRPGGSPEPPAAAPQSTAPQSTAPSTTVTPRPIPAHDIVMCHLGAPARPNVVAAMRRFLPTIVVDTTHAYVCYRGYGTTHLAEQTITGTYRGVRIAVDFGPPDYGGSVDFAPGPGVSAKMILLGRAQAESAGVSVIVSAYGRSSSRTGLDGLQKLTDYIVLYLPLNG